MQFIPADSYDGMPKADDRAWEGVWIGVNLKTDEPPVGTENGIFTSRAVRRKPAHDRWPAAAVRGVRGLPWQLVPERAGDHLQQKAMPGKCGDLEPARTLEPDLPPRRFRTERKHVETYKYTSGRLGFHAQRHRRAHRLYTRHC